MPALAGKEAAPSPQEIRVYIIAEGQKAGVNLQKLDWLFGHESSYCWREGFYDPAIKGDDGNSRGCAQISRIYHPEVTDEQANDLIFSVHWTIKQILAGKIDEWSTIRLCRKLYPDCPF